MHFPDAIPVVVTRPFLVAMRDREMSALNLVVALVFIRVHMCPCPGELMHMRPQRGALCISDDSQPNLPRFATYSTQNRRSVIRVGAAPASFVRPPTRCVRRVKMFLTFFPPHSETFHHFRWHDQARACLVASLPLAPVSGAATSTPFSRSVRFRALVVRWAVLAAPHARSAPPAREPIGSP